MRSDNGSKIFIIIKKNAENIKQNSILCLKKNIDKACENREYIVPYTAY